MAQRILEDDKFSLDLETSLADLREAPAETLASDRDDDPCLDIYLSSAIPYFGEHYLAFPAAFMHFPNVPIWRNDNDGMWDVKLVHSRTGLDLQYIGGDRSQWIPRGTIPGVSSILRDAGARAAKH